MPTHLLSTQDYTVHKTGDEELARDCPYASLSHRWRETSSRSEIRFQDLNSPGVRGDDPKNSEFIKKTKGA